MKTIELPLLRATEVIAVTVEQAEIAGETVHVVTVREQPGRAPRRRWYPCVHEAIAYAAEAADRHGLLLIDLRDPGAVP